MPVAQEVIHLRPSVRQLVSVSFVLTIGKPNHYPQIETRFEAVSAPLPRDRTIALIALKKGTSYLFPSA